MNHVLKTWPEYFDAIARGKKTFEVRKMDRDFNEGDVLILMEWEPSKQEYTGRVLKKTVSYFMQGGRLGIKVGFCVMGLSHHSETRSL